uniref:Serine/threonine-protein kinase RIO1 n=1 Tax=Salix viminalis TaxID=40686 RepID=A0A6N2NHF1_SALVM
MSVTQQNIDQLEPLTSSNEARPEVEVQESEEEDSWSSDSEIADALDWLDTKNDDDSFDSAITLNSRRPNANGGLHSRPNSSTLQPLSNRNQKFTHHIRASPLEEWEGRVKVGMSNSVTTAIRHSVRDMAIGKTRNTEKADRATVEQANVYHATKTDGQELAIKVYKTSVLVFKIKAAGIRCPTPILLRLHVLVMEFIGKVGWAAPRLKDAALSLDKLRESYMEMIITMRTLYQKCKLVHGDLSEYNILYYEGRLYIIDVSQAVDLDHPHALDFLREDCLHVSDFFKKHGVAVMTIRELFDFIVDPTINDESIDSYLEEVQQKILTRDLTAEDEIADSVFVQSYIPKTLDDVKHAEEDVMRITSGNDTGDMYYKTITGLKEALSSSSAAQQERRQVDANPVEESSVIQDGHSNSPESESDSGTDGEEEDSVDSDGSGSSSETEKQDPADKKAARKEHKKKVKEEKREARKTKTPKAMKKRKKKMAKAKKTR